MESNALNNLQSDQTNSYLNLLHNTERKELLQNLIMKCRKEMESNSLHKPLEDYVERVAYYTGIPKRNVNLFISTELGDIDYENKYFELTHHIEILKSLKDMYVNKQIPTHDNIFTLLKHLKKNISFVQFQYMMSCLGFEYRNVEMGKEILVEDPDLTFERYMYLKQIIALKSKCAPIYYIDEIYVDSNYTCSEPWIKNIRSMNNKTISSEGCDGYVFFHAVSRRGFHNGLFCSPTTKTDFIKWLTHILLPLFEEPSIIVMDSNDLHRCNIKTITKYHTKEDMLQYLRQKNIPCNENLHKAELYKLIRQCTVASVYSKVDDIVKAHGHRVLWLPSTFHYLSLNHLLWKHILESKTWLLQNAPLKSFKNNLLKIISNLPEYCWVNFNRDLSNMEKGIFDIDSQAMEALDTNYTFVEKTN